MILDANYLLSGTSSASGATYVVIGQALTSAGLFTTLASSNVIDLVNARDMGEEGNPYPLKIMVLCTAAFTSTGAATLQVLAQGSTDNTTYTTYAETPAIIATSITAGKMIANFDWPGVLPNDGALPRYLRLAYTNGVSAISAGSVISTLVLGRDMSPNRNYPPGYSVVN